MYMYGVVKFAFWSKNSNKFDYYFLLFVKENKNKIGVKNFLKKEIK